MANSSSDCSLSADDTDYESVSDPSQHRSEARRTLRNGTKIAVKVSQPRKQWYKLPSEIRQVVAMKKHVTKQLHGSDFDKGLSLRVIKAALTMQVDYLKEVKRRGAAKQSSVRPPAVRKTICHYLGISPATYSCIINRYLEDRTVYASGQEGQGRTGNRAVRVTRIKRTKANQILIRNFVRGKRMNRERVTAKQLVLLRNRDTECFLRRLIIATSSRSSCCGRTSRGRLAASTATERT